MRTAVGCLVTVAVVALLSWIGLLVVFGVRVLDVSQMWPAVQWRQVWGSDLWRGDMVGSLWPVLFGGAAWFGRWIVGLALGLAACALFPHRIERMAWFAVSRPWAALGMGIIAAVAAGVAVALLAITIVGIPLALLLAGCVGLAQAVGLAAIGLAVGQKIRTALGAAEPDRPLVDVAFGMTLLLAVGLVPVAGWLISLAAKAMALGAVAMTRLGTVVE